MDKAIEILKIIIEKRKYEIQHEDDIRILAYNKFSNEYMVVFLVPVTKFNTDKGKEYISYLEKMGKKHCIIVYTELNGITPAAKKIIDNNLGILLELFHIDELQYDITEHRLVPQFIKLSDEESKDFKKKYDNKFPALLKSDPICKFYNFKKGSVIRIICNFNNTTYIKYRIVK